MKKQILQRALCFLLVGCFAVSAVPAFALEQDSQTPIILQTQASEARQAASDVYGSEAASSSSSEAASSSSSEATSSSSGEAASSPSSEAASSSSSEATSSSSSEAASSSSSEAASSSSSEAASSSSSEAASSSSSEAAAEDFLSDDGVYDRQFNEANEVFNKTELVGGYDSFQIADGVLKLPSFKTRRFLDADSPSRADGVFTVRFKSDVEVERFGFFVRTNNNSNERVIISYDPAAGDFAGGWYWRSINGGQGILCEAEAPKANQWYILKLTYVGTKLTLEITDESAGNTVVTASVEMPADKAYTGAGKIGIAHWGYTTKNIEIDYMKSEPISAQPQSVSISTAGDANTVAVGETLSVSATVLPADASQSVTWSISEETGKATVNENGVVTGVAEGTVKIFATAINGVKSEEKQITITPAEQGTIYHRSFDEQDPIKTYNTKVLQAGSGTSSIADGCLKLENFFQRHLDMDSPLHRDGILSVKFKISENEGRYGFYVRTVDATNRIMVAYDTDGWYWMGMNGARGLIGTADPLTPETWYTAKITYVENDIKLSITDESTGTTKVIGKATMDNVPLEPGHIGFVSWWKAKNITVDDILIEKYVEKGPTNPLPYDSVSISSDVMQVTLDKRYPTVNEYKLLDTNQTMAAQDPSEYLFQVELNDELYESVVTDVSAQGNKAVYQIEIDALKNVDSPEEGSYGKVKLEVTCMVDENIFTMDTKVIEEPDVFRIHSLRFPDQKLLRADYRTSDAILPTLAGVYSTGGHNSVADHQYNLADDTYSVLGGADVKNYSAIGTGSLVYPFMTNGILSGTVLNNVDETKSKTLVSVSKNDSTARTLSISSGAWDYRVPQVGTVPYNETQFPPLESMWSKVVISGDRNADTAVDWQDAAINLRENREVPFGGEEIKDHVTYIMYNAASKAQSDFNASTDMMKKLYNLYDGFGQFQMQKGYQAEGHDDAHNDAGGHISERIGGVEGFKQLLAASRRYNTEIGVHVNITEMMTDAFYPKVEYFKGFEEGSLKRNWQWYDTAFLMNEDIDLLSGELEKRFAQLAEDTTLDGETKSALGWIYVDIYARSDWHSRQVAEIFEKYGWWTATEFSGPFLQNAVWTHWGTDLYYPTSGNGSRYLRFIQNSTSDTSPADSPYVSTLLKGMQQPSVSAWMNKYEIGEAISLFYEQNLVSKYLQHFEIMKWNDDNTRMEFSEGVVSEVRDGKLYVSRNGKTVAICDLKLTESGRLDVRADSLVFIPWDPITEDKVYHWNPVGGKTTWDVPDSWSNVSSVYLYENTENGKVLVAELPVTDGKVTIDAAANTPYSIYRTEKEAAMTPAAGDWSENSLIKDTGFDAQVFVDEADVNARWNRTAEDGSAGHVIFTKDVRYNNLLTIDSQEDAEVYQDIAGLTPGKTYAVSLWTLIENDTDRMVTLCVENSDGTQVEAYLRKTDVPAVKNKFQTTNFRRMRVIFKADEQGKARIRLRVADGSSEASKVYIDDVRIFEFITEPTETGHYFYDDFENSDFSLGAFEHDSFQSDNVHLADQHPEFGKGVDGVNQYMSYVIDGRYSAKLNDTSTAVGNSIIRTHPSVLRFKANSEFSVSVSYYTPIDGAYKLVAKNSAGEVLAELPLPKNGEPFAIGEKGTQPDPAKRKPTGTVVSFSFETGADEDCYLSVVKTAPTKDRITDYLILDNLVVDEILPTYKVQVTAGEHGTLQATPSDVVTAGGSVVFKAIPQNGYEVQEFIVNGQNVTEELSEAGEYTLTNVQSDVIASCIFAKSTVQVKKDALQKAIEAAEALERDDYTDASWTVFEQALLNAKRVFADNAATQETVDAAVKALKDAQEALVKRSESTPPSDSQGQNSSSTVTGVQTGDSMPIGMVVMLLTFAVLGMLLLVVKHHRKHS